MNTSPIDRARSDPGHARTRAREMIQSIRRGDFQGQTAGAAPGIVQGNVAILPADWAEEFVRFCRLNPKPCPLIGLGEPGDPRLPELGEDIDISTDVPMYRVFRDGVAVEDVPDIRHLWRDDLVAFVLGCSFSFEEALVQAGVPMRHIERGCEVPMFRTNIETRPAGRYHGPTVVSMRPLTPAQAIRAIQVTSRFPNVHGAPIHFGDPAAIGIADVHKPDFGEMVPVLEGEVPVFWACGVTPQAIVEKAKPPLCITHKPGYMLVTELLNAELSIL
ncbi:MAG TPA: putative hydro-lyase [Alphaproteobacteria bacterium]|nr:putative hydro-lyase [Alphaproteobacteria bacterium]